MAETPEHLSERFWKRVTPGTQEECWNWQGGRLKVGYGILWSLSRFGLPRRVIAAHRLSYQLHKGLIPQGLQVLHTCDNRLCVNPTHLFLGTIADIMRDKARKGRQVWGEAHGGHKLSKDQVLEIRKRAGLGESQTSLGREFGVAQATIHDVQHKSWQHL